MPSSAASLRRDERRRRTSPCSGTSWRTGSGSSAPPPASPRASRRDAALPHVAWGEMGDLSIRASRKRGSRTKVGHGHNVEHAPGLPARDPGGCAAGRGSGIHRPSEPAIGLFRGIYNGYLFLHPTVKTPHSHRRHRSTPSHRRRPPPRYSQAAVLQYKRHRFSHPRHGCMARLGNGDTLPAPVMAPTAVALEYVVNRQRCGRDPSALSTLSTRLAASRCP